jgi:hypothetical protein
MEPYPFRRLVLPLASPLVAPRCGGLVDRTDLLDERAWVVRPAPVLGPRAEVLLPEAFNCCRDRQLYPRSSRNNGSAPIVLYLRHPHIGG